MGQDNEVIRGSDAIRHVAGIIIDLRKQRVAYLLGLLLNTGNSNAPCEADQQRPVTQLDTGQQTLDGQR